MKKSNISVTLDELAIRTSRAYRQSGDYWMVAAAGLVEARDIVPHGEWAAHLRKTGVPARTATRMMRLARAGIKTATVADFGVGRVDELLGRFEAVGMPEGGDWDELVNFIEVVLDPAWTLWIKTAKHFEDSGRTDLRDRIDEIQPTSFETSLAWAEWAAFIQNSDGNPEDKAQWEAASPWKWDFPSHEPEPDRIAFVRCATEYVKEYLAKMDAEAA